MLFIDYYSMGSKIHKIFVTPTPALPLEGKGVPSHRLVRWNPPPSGGVRGGLSIDSYLHN